MTILIVDDNLQMRLFIKNIVIKMGHTVIEADDGTAGGVNSGVTTLTDATSNSYDGTLQNFALTGSTSNWVGSDALPVELTSFTAQANGNNNVILNWETATEVNNYGFEIERKIECLNDGMNEWEKIGFVEGYGNSNSPKSYTFIDDLNLIPNPNLTRIYYRLKQIDLDGSYEYYNTIAEVNLGVTSVNGEVLPTEFSLSQNFPNPFNPSTTIKFAIPFVGDALNESPTPVLLKVFDILGREIITLVNETKSPGFYEVE